MSRTNARSAVPVHAGYRDFNANVGVMSPSGTLHICELQIHLKCILQIKNSEGHETYDAARMLHARRTYSF